MPTIITAGDSVSAALSLAAGNDGLLNIVVGPAGGKVTALTADAAGKVSLPQGSGGGFLTLGTAVATTSGISVPYTGLPTWAKRLTVGLKNVSITSTANTLLQFGVAGSLVTTGYQSVAVGLQTATPGTVSSTAGFVLTNGSFTGPVNFMSGIVTLISMGGNDWAMQSTLVRDDGSTVFSAAGRVTLAGAPDRIALVTADGTSTFDQGSYNVLIEG